MTDCIVIGGGLVGLLTAYMLNEAGLDVELFDKGELGAESSWASGGILSPLYPWRYPDIVTRMSREAQLLYPALAQRLTEESGIDPEYSQSGLLIVDCNEHDIELAGSWSKKHGENIVTTTSPAQYEKNINQGFNQAIWLPNCAHIRSPRLIKSLAVGLKIRGLRIHQHVAVDELIVRHDSIMGVLTREGKTLAPKVIVAGGAWTPGLMPALSTPLKIQPVRGQMIRFAAKSNLLSRMILHNGYYLIPRRDGGILAGSTLESVGFNASTTAQGYSELLEAASTMLPMLANTPISHHWAGLRPGSPSNVPYIGVDPRISGLYVNSGHFRYGVLLGLPSARLITQIITGDSPKFDLKHFMPAKI